MGVEQGDYIEYGGGSGDSYGGMDYGGELYVADIGGGGGGGYDIGVDYADFYGGAETTPIDYGFDTTSWPTLDQGGGGPVADQAWMIDQSSGYLDMGDGYLYDPSTGGVLDTGLYQGSGGSDLVGAFFDYYSGQGYDDYTALQLAVQDAAGGSILTETSEQGPLPDLPEGQFFPLPYVDYWQSPFYTPTFPDLPAPPPPSTPLPLSPASSQPNLPPACAAGTYHPYPIGHPQQNVCVPFPGPQSQAPKPPSATSGTTGSTSKPPAPQQKPPVQQQCPQGYYRDPATGQCKPIPQGQPQQCPSGYYRASNGQCFPIPRCTTPGTVFDQATGLCVPRGQAIAPLPEGIEGLFDELKNLPWWLWLALAGLLLLSKDDDGKKTTVAYRRGR